jgi:hypothetical protein
VVAATFAVNLTAVPKLADADEAVSAVAVAAWVMVTVIEFDVEVSSVELPP